MAPSLTAIVVNYERADLLRPCLESLLTAVDRSPLEGEVVVVDNASRDGSAQLVRERFPSVRLLELDRNLGFAGGVAHALARSHGEWVFLLNNDATIEPDALTHLLAAARPEDVGAVAAQMRFADRPEVVNSAGIGVDALGVAYDRDLGRRAAGGDPVEVFGASAGAALYRAGMLAEIGGFDPRFFVYLEDVDVAWRARMAGWRALYVPRAVVWHHHAATAGHGSALKYFHVGRNRVRLLARNADGRHLLRHAPALLAYDLAYVAFVAVRDRTLAPLRGRVAGLREWRRYRALGAALRRPVPLDPVLGLRAALRRRAAWRGRGPA